MRDIPFEVRHNLERLQVGIASTFATKLNACSVSAEHQSAELTAGRTVEINFVKI